MHAGVGGHTGKIRVRRARQTRRDAKTKDLSYSKRRKLRARGPSASAAGHFKMCQGALASVTIAALPFRPNVN